MYKQFLKQHAWKYIPGVLLIVACSYLSTRTAVLLGDIFDLFDVRPIVRSDVMGCALRMVGVVAAVFVLRFGWRYFMMGNARHMECMLREQLFEHLQQMPPTFYQSRKTGDLMAYAINDIGAIRQTFGPALCMALQGIVTGAVSVAAMVTTINARLSLLALIPVPVVIVLIAILGKAVRSRFTVVQSTFAEVSDRVNENVGGIRVVKAYVQEHSEMERFEELNGRMKSSSMRMVRVSSAIQPIIELMFGISFTIGIIYGAQLVRAGTISVGDFVSFNAFLTLIIQPVRSLGRIINVVQRGRASGRRLRDILGAPSNVPEGEGTLGAYSGALEVRHLTFTYPGADQPALRDVSFTLEPGKTLGIIGHTGSGKTAIANALMKFYPVPDGTIFMDGRDINELTLMSLRTQYGCVPQDGFLFSDTIRSNIKFYDPYATDADMEEAARLADMADTIAEFPKGYDTELGERGVNLSGGQKQRLSIARALVKKPKIYLFDDALAAVDTRTEGRIITALRTATAGRTAIYVAHRASVIMHADEIIVLEEGRVAERGTHEQLLALGGKYAELWRIQSGEETEEVGA